MGSTRLFVSALATWLGGLREAGDVGGAGPEQREVFSVQLLTFYFKLSTPRQSQHDAQQLYGIILSGRSRAGLAAARFWPWVLPQEQILSFPQHFVVLAGRQKLGCVAPGLASSHTLLSALL